MSKKAMKKVVAKKAVAKKAAGKKVAAKKAASKKAPAKKAVLPPPPTLVVPLVSPEIHIWEDDPESVGASTIAIPPPGNLDARLQINIIGEVPPVAIYPPGSAEFRYWNTRAALVRCRNFWVDIMPPDATWQTGSSMLHVALDAGVLLNASYNRLSGLRFFHDSVNGRDIFTADSPDIVAHELGHAMLDALQPTLALSNTFETAAFHEAFGDISALLTALQLPSFCSSLLARHGNMIERDSRWTRIGEAFGRALHERDPDRASPTCLRNAANSFFYQSPQFLPTSGPDAILTREPHSLARTFLGAFLQAFAQLARSDAATLTTESLQASATKAGALLILAVRHAPVQTDYFFQVASALVSQSALYDEKGARNAFAAAFVRRGILPIEAQNGSWPNPSPPGPLSAAGEPTPGEVSFSAAGSFSAIPTAQPDIVFDGGRFGLKGVSLTIPRQVAQVAVAASQPFINGLHKSVASAINTSLPPGLVQDLAHHLLHRVQTALVAIPATPSNAENVAFGAASLINARSVIKAASEAPPAATATLPANQPLIHEEAFIHYLFQRGRVDFAADTISMSAVGPIEARKTHRLTRQNEEVTLERVGFDCGFD